MSKKFKSQASSARAASATLGGQSFGFGATPSGFQSASSLLSYVTEAPDLSGISEPQVVVSFKNLSKKDNVTKAKGLEEIQQYVTSVQTNGGILETSIIETWTSIYPRLSIENARRVRQLAHTLQGSLATYTGKRIVPYLPKVIGPWLAGLFDNDKSVSRGAKDSFEWCFATDQKRENVWKIYHADIVAFVEDATTLQTPQTLSDERTVSPDDAEAKHVRLVGASLLVLDRFIATIKARKISKRADVDKLLTTEKLWDYAHHPDPFPQRGACILLQTCLDLEANNLDWAMISACFLSRSLHVSHLGSSLVYAETVSKLSHIHPSVWINDYSAKTSSSKRLFQFLKQGSQRGPEKVWTVISQIIHRVPEAVWSYGSKASETESSVKLEGVSTLLEALHSGVTHPEEPRSNATAAWTVYTNIGLWAIKKLKSEDEAHSAIDKYIFPLIKQLVNASPDQLKWIIPGKSAPGICGECLSQLFDVYDVWAIDMLKDLSSRLLDQMKLSLPEQAKDFRISQDLIISHSKRMLALMSNTLQVLVQEKGANQSGVGAMEGNLAYLVRGAMRLLRDRNGKPYGAAALLDLVVRETPTLIFSPRQYKVGQELADFLHEDVPKLLGSPSTDLLVSTAVTCDDQPGFQNSLKTIVQAILGQETNESSPILRQILKSVDAAKLKRYPELESYVSRNVDSALKGDTAKWDDLQHLLGSQIELSEATDRILSTILSGIHLQETQDGALTGIESLLRHSGQIFSGAELPSQLGRLVLELQDLTYFEDEAGERAASLNKELKEKVAQGGDDAMWRLLASVVQEQLSNCNAESASPRALAEVAQESIHPIPETERVEKIPKLIPSEHLWTQIFSEFVDYGPNESHAITSSLGGTVNFIDRPSFDESQIHAYKEKRDSNALSPLTRLTSYVVKLLKSSKHVVYLDTGSLRALFLYLPRCLQHLEDKLNDTVVNEAWGAVTPLMEAEMAELVADGNTLVKNWIHEQAEAASQDSITFESCWLEEFENLKQTSASIYNLGNSFTHVMSECISITGVIKFSTFWDSKLKSIRSSPDIVQSACLVVLCNDWLGSSAVGKRLCNEFIASAMEPYENNREIVARRLCLFNLLVSDNDMNLRAVPQHRLVMLVKHILGILQSDNGAECPRAEMLKAIYHIVPLIADVFGEHWQQTFEEITRCIGKADGPQHTLPSLNIALRLLLRLNSYVGKESNEDLEDAWEDQRLRITRALLESLQNNNAFVLEIEDQKLDASKTSFGKARSKPRSITLDLMARVVRKLEIFDTDDSTEFLPLLDADEKAIQDAGFDILHRSIPQKQEQISFDVALSKTVVHLPEELLSLLLDVPEDYPITPPSLSLNASFLGVRRYLLSWKIVFDYFRNASHKVQETYVNDIKESEHLNHFLDLAVEVLRITAKPIDPSKYEIRDFEIDDFIDPEREISWLVVHLYYLSLQHLSGLTRSWWIDSRNRIKVPLEAWTDKYITPLITSGAMAAVAEWAATLDQTEERPLQVKISPNRSELIASIVIDEENPAISIAISLPHSYPFQPASVSSRHRVGVDEKKWQSWLRTIQIIILTSNSLIDGLLAFRRNVLGALKGQSECAICYSVIGQDMKPPDKPCKTCKNNFHSACLFRWFKSSSSSTCPLCRNNFNYA